MNHQIILALFLGAFVGSCATAIVIAFFVDRYLAEVEHRKD